MTKKRAKLEKHKKERKRLSAPPCVDGVKGKDETEVSSSSTEGSKHKHVSRRRGTSYPQSFTDDSPEKDTYKKPDGKNKHAAFQGGTSFQNSDHRALHGSVKHSSSRHHVSSTGKCSKSQTPSRPACDVSCKDLEKERKRLIKKRLLQEKLRWRSPKAAYESEKKRKPSVEEHFPVFKRQSIKDQHGEGVLHRKSEELSHQRKKLMERRSSDKEVVLEEKRSTKTSTETQSSPSKDALSVKNQEPAVTPKAIQHASPETQGNDRQKEQSTSAGHPSSGKAGNELLSYSPISFKIPKKSSAVKGQRDTNVWNNYMSVVKKRHPPLVSVNSESANASPQENKLQLSDVPSQGPLCSESHKPYSTRKRLSPSDTPADHTVRQGSSAEPTESFDNDQMQLVEELHLARSDQRLQVNVVKSYGELTCMDVDPPEGGTNMTHIFSGEHQQDLLIVLDTNILLSHLDFVKKMRSHGLGALGFPTLLIPWVVLQELDALKSGKLSQNVECKARPAVHYIYSCLKSQEPRLWGQSMQQASQTSGGLGVRNNDDRVLQCCLQFQMLYPDGTLILCTNDKNLCSKALLSGVKALSKADLVEQAEVNPGLLKCNYTRDTAQPSPEHAKKHHTLIPRKRHTAEQETKLCGKEKVVGRKHTAGAERDLSVCVPLLESNLQRALSAILEEEMRAAFGELWTEIVYLKPPWTLDAVLQCFRKHWIAVFGNIVKRSLLSCVETLSNCLCSGASVDRGSVLTALCAAEKLLMALGCRSQYSGHIAQTLSFLQTLQHRLKGQPHKSSLEDTSDGDTLMVEAVEDVAPPPHTSPQDVWAFFESLWNNLCHVSSALFSALHYSPGSTQIVQPFSTPPSQDALNCLHRLSAALGQLLEAFQRVLSMNSTVEDAQALLTVVHTSMIAAMEPRFAAEDLFECLSQQEYREKLCVGGAQLMELRANLDHCGAAVCGQSGSST